MTSAARNNIIKKSKRLKIISNIITYFVLILAAFLILGPLYVVLITSFKSRTEAMSESFSLWPDHFDLHGYKEVFTYTSGAGDTIPTIVRGFINTLIVSLPTSIVGTLVSALAAFSFSKIRFRSKKFLFAILIGTMMIPGTISMIPSYILFDRIGWVDTFLPLIIPGLLGGASTVFFLRQFFFSVPDELIDAAKIDGLGHFGIFFSIMIPLSIPALIAQFVLAFVGSYNAYMGPLIYLQTPTKYTLQIALRFFQSTNGTDYAVLMAGAVVSLVPTLIIYLFGQRYFIDGIATTGLKL